MWGIKSAQNFDSRKTRPQSARKAWQETVTHSCSDHARSCLTKAFESECSRCAPPTPIARHTTSTSSSVQSLDRLGRRGDMRDDSAETLFQSFLQEALRSSGPSAVRSCGMGRDVHSLMFSIQHFLCRPRRRPPSNLP